MEGFSLLWLLSFVRSNNFSSHIAFEFGFGFIAGKGGAEKREYLRYQRLLELMTSDLIGNEMFSMGKRLEVKN